MKILLFGATGMIGQGVLREALLDPDVERVLAVVRTSTGQTHPKLQEILRDDLADFKGVEDEIAAVDACLYCLGVSSAGMNEADYRRVTFDMTLAAAKVLVEKNPKMTFIYISGAGTDGSEKGGSMWARVKGQTENALLALPFKGKFMMRPGFIQPRHGIRSKTKLYRVLYAILSPLYPLWRTLFPSLVTDTEKLGKAMLAVAKNGADKAVLETTDISRLG